MTQLAALLKILDEVLKFCWLHNIKIFIITIVCFLVESITNPQGFINFWICNSIDIIFDSGVLPSTPDNMKISFLLAAAINQNSFGSAIVSEILVTLVGLLSIFSTVKLIKFFKS